MISFDKFKEQVTLGYMACGNKVSVSMYFCNKSNSLFTKHIEVTINAYVGPGQHLEMPFDKLRESITDKIYYWYQEILYIFRLRQSKFLDFPFWHELSHLKLLQVL